MRRFIILFVTATLLLGSRSTAQAQSIYLAYGDREITLDEKKLENYLDHVTNKVEEAVEQVEKSLEKFEKEAEKFEKEIEKGEFKIVIENDNKQRFRGSGRIITETRPVPADYHGVEASRAIKVTMENRTGSTATVRADDNVMPFIKIENDNGILEIKIDEEIRTINNVTAEVTLPMSTNISHLEAESAARINVEYTITSTRLNIEASSAADINIAKAYVTHCDIESSSAANVTASIKATECHMEAASAAKVKANLLVNECYADASSAADITLSGEAGTLNLQASSAADIKATEIKALVKTSADASSGANIKVNAGKALSANASSGGSVGYKSEHDVDIHIKKSSGGSVHKL